MSWIWTWNGFINNTKNILTIQKFGYYFLPIEVVCVEDNLDQDNLLQPTPEQVNNNSSSLPLSEQPKRSTSAPPLALIRAPSLSWKALKKAFVRSYSFS
ncbi:hypothetical protein LIER_13494 [Lithospermum erythrorhizon]|uniref:Uncharacterized protein n=1 Tax=Lithospermum erythrorhizon TaxID=34254 RepID=A0AAV3PXU5_LITER